MKEEEVEKLITHTISKVIEILEKIIKEDVQRKVKDTQFRGENWNTKI